MPTRVSSSPTNSFKSSSSSKTNNLSPIDIRLSSSSSISSSSKSSGSTSASSKALSTNELMSHYSTMSKEYLQIITAFCLCLLIMNCVYIAFALFDIDKGLIVNTNQTSATTSTTAIVSNERKSSCIAIGVLMHYFLLASFCFSSCITLIQFFIVYRSFSIFRWLFIKSSVFSFGVPLLVIAIVLGIDTNAYVNPNV